MLLFSSLQSRMEKMHALAQQWNHVVSTHDISLGPWGAHGNPYAFTPDQEAKVQALIQSLPLEQEHHALIHKYHQPVIDANDPTQKEISEPTCYQFMRTLIDNSLYGVCERSIEDIIEEDKVSRREAATIYVRESKDIRDRLGKSAPYALLVVNELFNNLRNPNHMIDPTMVEEFTKNIARAGAIIDERARFYRTLEHNLRLRAEAPGDTIWNDVKHEARSRKLQELLLSNVGNAERFMMASDHEDIIDQLNRLESDDTPPFIEPQDVHNARDRLIYEAGIYRKTAKLLEQQKEYIGKLKSLFKGIPAVNKSGYSR